MILIEIPVSIQVSLAAAHVSQDTMMTQAGSGGNCARKGGRPADGSDDKITRTMNDWTMAFSGGQSTSTILF